MNKKKIIYTAVAILGLVSTAIAYMLYRYQNTSPKRLEHSYTGEIAVSVQLYDKDRDGLVDGDDIIIGAVEYIRTKPKYESRYYSGGYPDDGHGVCTDVVINGLLKAGYNLKELVDKDIEENIEHYNIEKPDKNIDFRRVRNIKVYLDYNALSLTKDVHDINAWQGGDIVVFKKHIALVSDRRNENGVPYIIHHNDPWQLRYEEDLLEKRDDIVGHYRMYAG